MSPNPLNPQPDPADVAARLRRVTAHRSERRWLRLQLASEYYRFADDLVAAAEILIDQAVIEGDVIGRLRRAAQQQERNAELVREQRYLAIANKKPAPLREAA